MKTTFGIALAICVIYCESARGEVREWTNDQGRKIQAELLEIDGENAVLKMGTTTYPVAVKSLSAEDQKFIAEWQKMKAGGDGEEADATEVRENWDDPWPKIVATDNDPEIEIVTESEEGYVYASPHYEFHCDTKLSKSVIKKFAVLFEATNAMCRELPLGMKKAHTEKRFKIYLFETKQSYAAAGGPDGSAGVYMSGKDIILIPLTSLGVKKVGNRYIVDYDKSNKTLPHEIAHQLTDPEYFLPGSRGWFSEGLAEYIGTTPYRSGKFQVDSLSTIKEYVTAGEERYEDGWIFYQGRKLGDEITMPDLKDWMLQSYSSFLNDGNRNYGVGALVVYYFFHMDGEKDAACVKNFLKAIKDGKQGEEALNVLLNGRSFDEMEAQITKEWRSRGVKIIWN